MDDIAFGSFVGVSSPTKNKFQVFNTSEGIRILTNENTPIDQVEIFDLTGKRVFVSESKINSNTFIPFSIHASGVYLIKIKSNTSIQTIKIMAAE